MYGYGDNWINISTNKQWLNWCQTLSETHTHTHSIYTNSHGRIFPTKNGKQLATFAVDGLKSGFDSIKQIDTSLTYKWSYASHHITSAPAIAYTNILNRCAHVNVCVCVANVRRCDTPINRKPQNERCTHLLSLLHPHQIDLYFWRSHRALNTFWRTLFTRRLLFFLLSLSLRSIVDEHEWSWACVCCSIYHTYISFDRFSTIFSRSHSLSLSLYFNR